MGRNNFCLYRWCFCAISCSDSDFRSWMGLAAPSYCCWLGRFSTVTDTKSQLIWTKAAPVSPRALLRSTQMCAAHVFSLTWSQTCLHELQTVHSCTPQCELSLSDWEPVCVPQLSLLSFGWTWVVRCLLRYITFLQKLYIRRYQLWVFWFLPYLFGSLDSYLSHLFLNKNHFARFLLLCCHYLSVCFIHMAYSSLCCRCVNISKTSVGIRWINGTASQMQCNLLYTGIVVLFKWALI